MTLFGIVKHLDKIKYLSLRFVPDLGISDTLPTNKLKLIELPVLKTGEYDFHCQMQRYLGKLIVK
ncbi:cupredoxin domain-containing protein [Idiomarina sp. PL1-037]|uniref:cupredoxin domain-containing protein n=1 Tax=Idiomarina sp. PL1-037 TaxID=3095365 RepID=UPI003A0FC2C2